MHSYLQELSKGAAGGFAATGPMTACMEGLHALLPPEHQDPLPPRHITDRVTEAAGVRHELSEQEQRRLTLAAHFGFGTAAGAVYGLVASRLNPPPVLGGIAYGL